MREDILCCSERYKREIPKLLKTVHVLQQDTLISFFPRFQLKIVKCKQYSGYDHEEALNSSRDEHEKNKRSTKFCGEI